MRRLVSALLVLACAAACGGSPQDASSGSEDDLGSCPAAAGLDGNYEFEDDVCHHKKYPTNRDRSLACPVVYTGGGGFLTGADDITVDENALKGIVPPELKVTLILIRRVDGRPLYKYLSNGTAEQAFQPWSSTKWMAVANAGAHLRELTDGAVGLTAQTRSGLPLGDLITNIENYDETHGFTSNGLAHWFHDIGGRPRANGLIHDDWLGRPAAETFGGNYGYPAPDLGYRFTAPDGTAVDVTPDATQGYSNSLSTLTMAEFLKRLAVNDADPDTTLPWLAAEDLQTLFYGPEQSVNYPGKWGGMSADDAIYIQAATGGIARIEQRSQGRWRIFSKLGFGNGEFVDNGYACFPVLDAQGKPVPDQGREFVLSVRLATGGVDWPHRDALLESYFKAIVTRVLDARIQ